PDGKRAAQACTGHLTATGEIEDLSQSALVFYDVSLSGLKETERLDVAQLGVEGLQNDVVFANAEYALIKSQTPYGGTSHNRWIALELSSKKVSTLLEARPDENGEGKGLTYGAMSCSPGCSDVCLLADSDRGVLQRVQIEAGRSPKLLTPVTVEEQVGLPPRGIASR
ncbi:MAG TPA: hypothetical protein VFQ61_30790, partial [Polyangiaceae bacterium]|nr:hypothetical protein [Polyangiaceae bacterium]